MFIHLDHIALAPPDPATMEAQLVHHGFQCVRRATALPNVDLKRPLLHTTHALHDLALFQRPKTVSIELLDHGSTTGACPALAVVSDPATPFAITAIRVQTHDVPRSQQFFADCGFTLTGTEQCTFRSLLHDVTLTVYLTSVAAPPVPWMLDAAGYNCLALVSSAIARDRDLLVERGWQPTALATTTVATQALQLFFVRGPAGELIEVIAPVRGAPPPTPRSV